MQSPRSVVVGMPTTLPSSITPSQCSNVLTRAISRVGSVWVVRGLTIVEGLERRAGPWTAAAQRRPTRVSAGVVGRWVSPGLAFRHAVSDARFVEDVGGAGGVVA